MRDLIAGRKKSYSQLDPEACESVKIVPTLQKITSYEFQSKQFPLQSAFRSTLTARACAQATPSHQPAHLPAARPSSNHPFCACNSRHPTPRCCTRTAVSSTENTKPSGLWPLNSTKNRGPGSRSLPELRLCAAAPMSSPGTRASSNSSR